MRIRSQLFCTGLALVLGTAAQAQQTPQVIISEINFSAQGTGDDQWIELLNPGTSKVDISNWSIYQTTKSPGLGLSGTYWWGFPPNTELDAGSFLRVHWLAPIPAVPQAGELYTGNTIFHFLFALFAEPLNANAGALALFRTQNNLSMNTAFLIEDWVSWGDTGFDRENLAVQNTRWAAGTSVGPATQKDSIAVKIDMVSSPTPIAAWFHDASPTPNSLNALGASGATQFGAPTRISPLLFADPILDAPNSFSAPGNRDFVLELANTTGVPGEMIFLAVAGNKTSGVNILGLAIWVDPNAIVATFGPIPGQFGSTPLIDFSLAPVIVAGLPFYAQAVMFDFNSISVMGSSNGLEFTVGNL